MVTQADSYDPRLALWFSPSAIRDHFEGDTEYEYLVDELSDEALTIVGEWALDSPVLYDLFHELLVAGLDQAPISED